MATGKIKPFMMKNMEINWIEDPYKESLLFTNFGESNPYKQFTQTLYQFKNIINRIKTCRMNDLERHYLFCLAHCKLGIMTHNCRPALQKMRIALKDAYEVNTYRGTLWIMDNCGLSLSSVYLLRSVLMLLIVNWPLIVGGNTLELNRRGIISNVNFGAFMTPINRIINLHTYQIEGLTENPIPPKLRKNTTLTYEACLEIARSILYMSFNDDF